MMFLALTISALVNIFWMWLIVNQIIRIINRQGEDVEGDVSQSAQSEDRGSEPSIQGGDDDRVELGVRYNFGRAGSGRYAQ